ncbi:MAG: phosphoglucosamine mutase [Pseudomonadota bacterium]
MAHSLFGTDGVRGRFGKEPITPDTILKLGWAAGTVLQEEGHDAHVLIGKDTRVSGYILESALEAGIAAAGLPVTLLGPLPTPGIAHLTRTTRASAGLVISASHNPFDDNGVKIFSHEGTKLSDRLVAAIDDRMMRSIECVPSNRLGKVSRLTDAKGRYIEFCKSTFPDSLSLSSLRIVVDCANGAAYEVAPRVLNELGAEVIAIANQPDGYNINDGCGSTHLEMLQARVVEESADIGIALDGDADRVLFVDHKGAIVDGDQILYVLARHRHADAHLEGGVVGTIMSNLGLEQGLAEMGIPFERAKVGDRYVHELLTKNQWQLGGEASGHTICIDKSTTGDGIIAALEVLKTMLESKSSLSDLTRDMKIYPQKMINVKVTSGASDQIVTHPSVVEALEQADRSLNGHGRVVLRPSGTEPLVRVMVEGRDNAEVDRLTSQLATVVESVSRNPV